MLEDIEGYDYDLLRFPCTAEVSGKNIILIPYTDEYTKLDVYNYTKREAEPTISTSQRFRYTHSKELGNRIAFEESKREEFATTPAVEFNKDIGGISNAGIIMPDVLPAPIVATAITKASPAVVTATAHGLSAGQLIRIVTSDMVELNGAVVKVTAVTDADTFEISVDSSGFASAEATKANIQPVAVQSAHDYKIFGITNTAGATITLSNVDAIAEGNIFTLSIAAGPFKRIDGKRVRVKSIDKDAFTVTTDLDASSFGAFDDISDGKGQLTGAYGFASIEPDAAIVDGNAHLGGVVLLAGASNPAGEKGDLVRFDF